MANLLSFARGAVQRVAHNINNDVVNPIQRDVVRPVQQVAQAAPAFVNNNIAKPLAQFPIDASNQIYNRAVAPALNLPHLTPTQVTPIRPLANAVQATGSLHQTIGSGLQTALTIGGGGLAKLGEAGATGAAGLVAPKAASTAITAARLGLNGVKTPVLNTAIKYGSGAITGGVGGAGFNAASAAGQGAKPMQIVKSGALGAGLGAGLGVGLPLVGAGAKGGIKVASNAVDNRVPLNAVGAVGKDVNQPPSLSPSVPPKTITTPSEKPLTSGQGSGLTAPEAKKLGKQLTTPPTTLPSITPPVGTKPLGVVKTVTQSPQTTAPLARDIQGSYNPLSNKVASKAASERIAADPQGAYHFAATTHSAEGNATAIQLAKQLESQGNHQAAADLMVTKAQQALQAGQGNQIYSMWDKLSPETVAQTAAKTIEKYNQTAKSPIPQLSADQYKGFVDQAKNIQGLAEGSRERGIATQNLLKQIGSLVPSSKTDKAFSLYRTGLLTGFRTPGKVGVSHAISSGFEQAKNLPAKAADVAIGVARAPFVGKYQRGLSLTARGNAAGAKKGAFAAVDNLIHGYDAPGSGGIAQDFANNVHFNTNTVHGKIAQTYVDTIGHLHGSLYKPFYGAQHLNSLYDMAITNAKNAGLKGAEKNSFVQDFVKKATDYSTKDQTGDAHANFSTPEGAAQRANAEAAYTTFQNKTALSQAAAAVKRSTPGARYIVPFSQIPSSIASKVVDYSPVGAIKEAITQAKNGTFDQRALSQAIGRSSTGTGLTALGYHLFNSGNITTAYPTDTKTQAQWKLEGKQANSVKVGGKWRQLSTLGPAGDTLAVGANVAEGMKGNKKTPGSVANAGIQGGIGAVNVLGNSPYLQGVQNVGAAISQPGTKSQKVAEGLAGGLIPTAVANIATASDSTQRQTNSPVDSVTNKIPGIREKNLPQVDVLGKNVPRAQGAIGSLLDPFYSTTAKSTPVTQELNRLNNTYNPATPSAITKNQSILGQKVNLNPKQLTQLQQQAGQPLSAQLSALIQTPEYKGASDETKAKAINDLTSQVRSSVKDSFATNSGGSTNAQPIVNTAKLASKAQLTLAKDSFDKSGKSYQVVGDTVLRRTPDGTISATPKIKFDYQVGTATLTSQKNAGDLQGYIKTAQGQLASIDKQLKDPSIDPLDALTLQNDATTLQKNIAKYSGYGGFTKGSSAGAQASKAVTAFKAGEAGFKTAKSKGVSAPKGIKVKVAKGSFKAPSVKKLAVSKIPSNFGSKKQLA